MIPYSTRIVFMGTPEFAVGPLQALNAAGIEIAGIVTSPDKPAGRGKKIKSSAVKVFASKHLNSPVLQPGNLKDPEFIQQLSDLNAQLFIVVAFRMLPEIVWKIPRDGTVNLHASLLPNYRGAAPINWAIINGETETGVSTFFINEEIDTGNILLQSKVPIHQEDDAGSLHDKLMEAGAELLLKTITHISGENIEAIEQSKFIKHDAELKKAPKIYKDDCKINWNKKSEEIHNLVRGLSPFPGAYTSINLFENEHVQLKIFKSELLPEAHSHQPGTLITDNKTYMKIATTDGFLNIEQLQISGKKRMSTADFLRGIPKNLSNQLLT